MTELVILIPVIVIMIYGGMYLTELGVFRLKAQEIARYSAWSMAVRPLSDFESFEHRELAERSRESALGELEELYVDLDGARERLPGRHGEYLTAFYSPDPNRDIRMQPTQLLPSALSYSWASPLSALAIALSALGIGAGTEDLFSGPFERVGMNGRGEARGRADVQLSAPVDPRDLAQRQALLAYERGRDFDLGDSRLLGRTIRDVGPDGSALDIQTVLVADPWRLERGYSAHPAYDGPYGKAVERVSDRAIEALPGGSFLRAVFSLAGITERLPAGLGAAFAGIPPEQPAAHLFSRPYTARRNGQSPSQLGQTAGRVDIFRETEGEPEPDAVRYFETMPLYLDHSYASGYLEALNRRGPNFMGCPEPQRRRCRW